MFKVYCLLSSFLLFLPSAADSLRRKLKHDVIEAVNELIQEISTCHEQIAEQAVEHIHHKYAFISLYNHYPHIFARHYIPLY